MPDVVGTAFVRIKALTDNLAKDIKSDVMKGFKGAKLDDVAKEEGESSGKAYGDGFADSSTKTLKKRSKAINPGDALFGDMFDGFQQLDFEDAINGVQEQFRQLEFDLPDVDTDPIEKAFAKIGDDQKKAADDLDNGSLSKSLIGLEKKLKNFGGGGFPALGLLKSKIALIGGAIVGVLPYIQDLGAGILAYATGLLAQVGFITTAIVGLGTAAGAALGSVALAALPIFLAFKAETSLLTEFKDSMGAAGEEFLRIGTATQQTLLPALDDAVFALGDLIPMFSEFGFFVGESVGNFAKFAAEVLVGSEAQGRWQKIMQSSMRILDLLLPTILNLGDILSGIWVAAGPIAERFVETLGKMVQRWTDMVNVGLESGTLGETLDTWYTRAETLFSALGNLSGAIFDIFEVGANSSDGVFARFDDWAERYRAWTESEVGQNKLALIFDNALEVMREVNGIAADLFDGIFGRLGEVGGVDSMVASLQKFRDVIPQIQEVWADAYTGIKQVVEIFKDAIWEKMKQTWEELKEPLGRLANQFFELLRVMNDSGAFEVLLKLLVIMTDTLATLLAIPGFGTFVAYFLAFGAATKIAMLALGPFVSAFGPFVGLIGKLGLLMKAGALTSTGGALAKIAAGAQAVTAAKTAGTLKGVNAAVRTAAGGAGGLASKITTVTSGLSKMGPYGLAAAGAVAVVGGAFLIHQRNAQKMAQEVRQVTSALGTLNDGLNITSEGVTKYITESSRFISRNQKDDLVRLGISMETLGRQVAEGSISYQDFAQSAVDAGEVMVELQDSSGTGFIDKKQTQSLKDLARQYSLTTEEIENLSKGERVRVDAGYLSLEGNDDLLESFEELNKVIGKAAKDGIDDFVTNAQNVRLLGRKALNDIKKDIDDADDEDAGGVMADAQKKLQVEARKSFHEIKGLTKATHDQILAQATAADGTIIWAKAEQLATDAIAKQNKQIQDNLVLFSSDAFPSAARDAVAGFIDIINDPAFAVEDMFGGLSLMPEKFGEVGDAALDLFTQLQQLPQEQFNAAATAMGVDADTLRGAMQGAMGAIKDLQDQAVASLPTIASLLDDATSVKEDGSQFFDEKGFADGIRTRTQDTINFAKNITTIKAKHGEEAARLAAQQGPKAAKALAETTGTSPGQLQGLLDSMKTAETALRDTIKKELGPGIAYEYGVQSGIIGKEWGTGLGQGLGSETTVVALKEAGLATLNVLKNGFQGKFVIKNDKLEFIPTGSFPRTGLTPGQRRLLTMATGGFVTESGVAGTFNKSFGTDTVPAMLTPGEYVIKRASVSRFGVDFFDALNRGEMSAADRPDRGRSSGRGGVVFQEGAVQVVAQGVSATAVIDEVNAKLGWQLTTRGDR